MKSAAVVRAVTTKPRGYLVAFVEKPTTGVTQSHCTVDSAGSCFSTTPVRISELLPTLSFFSFSLVTETQDVIAPWHYSEVVLPSRIWKRNLRETSGAQTVMYGEEFRWVWLPLWLFSLFSFARSSSHARLLVVRRETTQTTMKRTRTQCSSQSNSKFPVRALLLRLLRLYLLFRPPRLLSLFIPRLFCPSFLFPLTLHLL